jgi:DNA-binding transcriptional ArsR family regulator
VHGGKLTQEIRKAQDTGLDEQLGLVISNETTVKVLIYLVERAGSPKEIADALELNTPNVSHHVKKLLRLRLIELIEEKVVRGTIQHIYRAVVRPIMSDEEWEKLDVAEQQRYSIWIVQLILVDLTKSFAANLFDARANNHLSRTPLVVDELGVDEVAAIQKRALEETIQAEANSAERMVESGKRGINLIAAMMCFELPEPSAGLDRVDPETKPDSL